MGRLFDSGFRAFFLGAALLAAAAVPAWVAVYAAGAFHLLSLGYAWHAHEMLLGYAFAVFAGFLTIRSSGWRAALPFLLWAVARIALALPVAGPHWIGAAADLALVPVLVALRDPPLWSVWKWPNGVFLPVLLGFWAANLAFHADASGDLAWLSFALARDLSLDVVALLLAAMGGRLIPGYTGATLTHIRPPRRPGLELTSLLPIVFAAVMHAAGAGMPAGLALLASAGALALRQASWRPWETRGLPLLWILHAGYTWLILGLALRAVADLGAAVDATLAIHALTVGALGSLTLGMMTRITLNQTRSALQADAATAAAFALLQLAALVRVFGPLGAADPLAAHVAAALLWSLAFALWLARYARLLLA
jgi:uncharacterized protein involved in response to NO